MEFPMLSILTFLPLVGALFGSGVGTLVEQLRAVSVGGNYLSYFPQIGLQLLPFVARPVIHVFGP